MIGKVFWAGALAEMGGASPARSSRRCTSSPARSSCARPHELDGGRAEYSLAPAGQDVCYQQIPRAARAARHRAAAAWIERKAGERAEDLADVLAHHYLQALELARCRADGRRGGSRGERDPLPRPRRRARARPRHRLGRDSAAQALALCPPEDHQHPELLRRWARGHPGARAKRDRARRGARRLPRQWRHRGRSARADAARACLRLAEGDRSNALVAEGRRPARGRSARGGARRGLRGACGEPVPCRRLPRGDRDCRAGADACRAARSARTGARACLSRFRPRLPR